MASDIPPGSNFTVHCPICGATVRWHENPFRPFCSERCQVIDQAAWADESYTLPSEDTPGSDETGGGTGGGETGGA